MKSDPGGMTCAAGVFLSLPLTPPGEKTTIKKNFVESPKERFPMKKLTSLFCALALAAGLTIPAGALRPDTVPIRLHDEATLTYGPETAAEVVNVFLNGELMVSDLPAVSLTVDGVDGRTMVPVRPIAEALGAVVDWDGAARQVRIAAGGDTVVLTLGEPTAQVNGEIVELPGRVPALVARYGDTERTLVPLRFVSEQLHAQVEWDNEAYAARVTAVIEPPDPDAPPRGKLVRLGADDNAQSITLYLNSQPQYRVTDLGDRVAIDLLGVVIGSGQDGSLRPENPVVNRVRYAQHGTDIDPRENYVTRVVLDLNRNCSYEKNVSVTGDPNLQAVVITVTPPETGPVTPVLPEDWDPNAFTVVLDAGHGGSADGAVYEEVKEKDITLTVTLRAAELLEEKGYNVVLTRGEDVYMDLYDRCDVANNVGADIFVSIHANASSTNPDFQGTFTYSYPGSTRGEDLASHIQRAVVGELGSVDRGLLTNDYVVLRETTMPAALLEMGFMSCHEELERLVRPEYQEAAAQGVAKGVESYLATLPKKDGRSGGAGGTIVPAEG